MEFFLKYILIISFIRNVIGKYIVIPFDSFLFENKNRYILKEDPLSVRFQEDIIFNLSIGYPKQDIQMLLRLDQYELRIKEPNYISSLSKTFRPNKIIEKFICKENFYFMTINTANELNYFINNEESNKENEEKEIIKEYKDITFVYFNNTSNNKYIERDLSDYELNILYENNIGMLGLRPVQFQLDSYPQFLKTLKFSKYINISVFSFIFEKKPNSNHLGYLIIGDNFNINNEYPKPNITNFALRDGKMSWDLIMDKIYCESKQEKIGSYHENNMNAQLKVEISYILGSKNYKQFIEKEFFNGLVKDNICEYKNILIDKLYGTYVCDSKSKKFQEYYNNKFPDLVFMVKNIEDKLILTKNDLFFKNNNNISDTHIYFNVYFHLLSTTTWQLGRIFLSKYRFSFNLDTSLIYYYSRDNLEINNNNKNFDKEESKNIFYKIIFIIFLALIIFILGFLFHKSIVKNPRKIKANELDDEFYYPENKDKDKKLFNDLDINKENKNSNLYLELGNQKK